jgi:hypothetical protein
VSWKVHAVVVVCRSLSGSLSKLVKSPGVQRSLFVSRTRHESSFDESKKSTCNTVDRFQAHLSGKGRMSSRWWTSNEDSFDSIRRSATSGLQ